MAGETVVCIGSLVPAGVKMPDDLVRCPECGWRGAAQFGLFPVHAPPVPELTPGAAVVLPGRAPR